jgi:predicted ArsR family transcriptional regulator
MEYSEEYNKSLRIIPSVSKPGKTSFSFRYVSKEYVDRITATGDELKRYHREDQIKKILEPTPSDMIEYYNNCLKKENSED